MFSETKQEEAEEGLFLWRDTKSGITTLSRSLFLNAPLSMLLMYVPKSTNFNSLVNAKTSDWMPNI